MHGFKYKTLPQRCHRCQRWYRCQGCQRCHVCMYALLSVSALSSVSAVSLVSLVSLMLFGVTGVRRGGNDNRKSQRYIMGSNSIKVRNLVRILHIESYKNI